MKKLAKLIEISLTIAACIFLAKPLNYIYVNDCYSGSASWERSVLNDFYTLEENIDYLYLGSSHVFRDIIPVQMNNINKHSNFNLATSSQPYMASYYLLKEAIKRNNLEHVYLEMYYMIPYTFGNMDSAEVMTKNWNVLYQMPFSLNKLDYMCHLANRKYGMMTFLPVRQFSKHIFDTGYIKANLEQKKTENYIKAVHVLDQNAPLFENGFCTTTNHIESGTFEGNTSAIQDNWIDDNSKKYLHKIINLCQSHDIDITLFTSPMPDFRLSCMGNYDQYINNVNECAEEYGIHYYDFNICNDKYLPLQNDKYYTDYDHLSYEGAMLFTDVLGKVLLTEIEHKQLPPDMFYSTYTEKLRCIDERIFGLDIQQDTTQTAKTYMLYSINNLSETDVEFRVTKMQTGETQTTVVQEWSTQNRIIFPKTETGVFYVEARPVGHSLVTNRVETQY